MMTYEEAMQALEAVRKQQKEQLRAAYREAYGHEMPDPPPMSDEEHQEFEARLQSLSLEELRMEFRLISILTDENHRMALEQFQRVARRNKN